MEATQKGNQMKTQIIVSTLDFDGYDLIVTGTSKSANEKALLAEVNRVRDWNTMAVIKELYADDIRHAEIAEHGKVVWP